MEDKRAGLRKHFADEANQAQSVQMYNKRSAQLSDMENRIIRAFVELLKLIDTKTTKTEVINQKDSISTPDVENVVVELKKLAQTIISAKIDQKPVLDALNGLKREITLIPDKMPKPLEQKDNIKVSNLSEVKLDTSKLEKLVKDLKLNVDVKAPIINVDKPDLEPLKKWMADVVKAINNKTFDIKPPVVNVEKTDLSKVEKKLDISNKHLKELVDKPTGGGGGGGNGTPYVDETGKLTNPIMNSGSIPVYIGASDPTAGNNPSYTLDTVTVGLVHTLTLTKTIDSTVYTKTTVIDTSDNSITESAWV